MLRLCDKHPELGGKRYMNGACVACNVGYGKAGRKRDRKKVFDHYGAVCCRCGFDDTRALTVDHENQRGNEHKSPSGKRLTSYQLCRWLVANKFPEGFRVLCANCQFIVYHEHTDGHFHGEQL